MNAAINTGEPRGFNATTAFSWITGTGALQQIVLGILIATVLYISFMTFEIIYKQYKQVKGSMTEVLPLTVSSDSKPREFEQNPTMKNAKLLPLSDNERTGAEFTYSFFLWINPSSFRDEDGLLHIFHKGNPFPFPLLGPGVFLKSNTNTLRVYMNSSRTWNNHIDVENIPVKKWVHIVILARENAIEVYINGNLAKKLNIEGATLYQNFGNLYLFRPTNIILDPTTIPSLKGEFFRMFGTYKGSFSNLFYFNYALSYTEIQGLTALGVSKETEVEGENAPPYLEDAWWVNSYST
jgi:hypothetical protein